MRFLQSDPEKTWVPSWEQKWGELESVEGLERVPTWAPKAGRENSLLGDQQLEGRNLLRPWQV
jgi:hypothetical protein